MVPGSALSGRLPCAARASGLAHNSLRSLRSLRSDRSAKSELEAHEYVRAPRRCAARPCTNRPAAARAAGRLHRDRSAPSTVEHATFGGGSARRRAICARPRAQRSGSGACIHALRALTRRHLFDHSERSERREFGAAEPRSEHRGQSARRADPRTMSPAAGRATAARRINAAEVRNVPQAAASSPVYFAPQLSRKPVILLKTGLSLRWSTRSATK